MESRGLDAGVGRRRIADAGRSGVGFSLMEVIVATLIATIAITGLAYTFGLGRSFIDRYELSRAALAAAQGKVEALMATPVTSPDFTTGILHTEPFTVDGDSLGVVQWSAEPVDDPADGTAPTDPNPVDLKNVTIQVIFRQTAALDTIRLSRLFPAS